MVDPAVVAYLAYLAAFGVKRGIIDGLCSTLRPRFISNYEGALSRRTMAVRDQELASVSISELMTGDDLDSIYAATEALKDDVCRAPGLYGTGENTPVSGPLPGTLRRGFEPPRIPEEEEESSDG